MEGIWRYFEGLRVEKERKKEREREHERLVEVEKEEMAVPVMYDVGVQTERIGNWADAAAQTEVAKGRSRGTQTRQVVEKRREEKETKRDLGEIIRAVEEKEEVALGVREETVEKKRAKDDGEVEYGGRGIGKDLERRAEEEKRYRKVVEERDYWKREAEKLVEGREYEGTIMSSRNLE